MQLSEVRDTSDSKPTGEKEADNNSNSNGNSNTVNKHQQNKSTLLFRALELSLMLALELNSVRSGAFSTASGYTGGTSVSAGAFTLTKHSLTPSEKKELTLKSLAFLGGGADSEDKSQSRGLLSRVH